MREENSRQHLDFGDWQSHIPLWRQLRRDRQRIDREIERIILGYEPEPEEMDEELLRKYEV